MRCLGGMSIHIGEEIRKKVEEKGVAIVWLSKELGCHRTNIYRIFEKPTIDTGVLYRLSIILNFDFFQFYSDNVKERMKDDGM